MTIVVKITLHQVISLCSVYVSPPNMNIFEFFKLVKKVPSPFVMSGNFKGHNIILGDTDTYKYWYKIEDILLGNTINLCLFNTNKSATYTSIYRLICIK